MRDVQFADDTQASGDMIEGFATRVETALLDLDLDGDLSILDDPIRYVLAGGGKRLRPVLLLLAANLWLEDDTPAMPAALSVEVFHNFTLVHDDIMDHSTSRRGRETVHVRWDESTAILSGDYMLALAYRLLAESPAQHLPQLLASFHRMVRLLCEGQALDKQFETRRDVGIEDYFRMIHAKTGALIVCALEMGGIIGGAGERDLETLRSAGRHIGRAFQMQDDLLDLTATDARWGKPVGGDLIEAKRTFILLRAIERSTGSERQWFDSIIENGGLDPSLVPEARERLRRLGVLDDAASEVDRHSELALSALGTLPRHAARDALAGLILRMRSRLH
jgi:geranylgeranyl diphosphate synthase, type II